jgi:hypothetical protein
MSAAGHPGALVCRGYCDCGSHLAQLVAYAGGPPWHCGRAGNRLEMGHPLVRLE